MKSALHVVFVQHAQISKIKTFKANTIWTHYDLTIVLFLIYTVKKREKLIEKVYKRLKVRKFKIYSYLDNAEFLCKHIYKKHMKEHKA